MSDDLSKRLKSSEMSERKIGLDELRRIATEEAIKLLIEVTEGKRRTIFRKYIIEDQMYAIEKLVEIGTETIRGYINRFFEEEVSLRIVGPIQSILPFPYHLWWYEHNYPHAHGELGRRLKYTSDSPYQNFENQESNRDVTVHDFKDFILTKLNQWLFKNEV